MNRFIPAAALLAGLLCAAAAPPGSPAARLSAAEAQFPPWQNGQNNDAPDRGLVFRVRQLLLRHVRPGEGLR
jgi:hypothetical protein